MFNGAWRCLLGFLAIFVAAEIVLRILPVPTSTATGYHADPLIITYPAHHRWTMSTGWQLHNPQQLQSNNAGFVAEPEFVFDPAAVALVGDSFAEAAMLDAHDRPAEQLHRALSGRPVYAMGSPGSALLDYAERIRMARARYGTRDVVVMMERGDVRQSLCGSGQTQGPCIDRKSLLSRTETLPPPGAARRWLRHSALAQYFAGNLKFDAACLSASMAGSPSAVVQASDKAPAHAAHTTQVADARPYPPAYAAVTALFFERLQGLGIERLIIVLDTDRDAIYAGRAADDPDRASFMMLARRAGAIVIDTEPLYRAAFAERHLKLDVGPYDGHLNALGVELAMAAAAQALQAR